MYPLGYIPGTETVMTANAATTSSHLTCWLPLPRATNQLPARQADQTTGSGSSRITGDVHVNAWQKTIPDKWPDLCEHSGNTFSAHSVVAYEKDLRHATSACDSYPVSFQGFLIIFQWLSFYTECPFKNVFFITLKLRKKNVGNCTIMTSTTQQCIYFAWVTSALFSRLTCKQSTRIVWSSHKSIMRADRVPVGS